MMRLFATAPRGVEPILAAELATFGAQHIVPQRGGVAFQGDLATAYRACLWLRTASRVLLPLSTFHATSAAELYEGVKAIPWETHLTAQHTIAITCDAKADFLTNTHFGALKTKDALVDRLRERTGQRPRVDLDHPDIRIHCRILRDQVTVSLDLSGDSLHRRGYRQSAQAPLKENLAAALLLHAGLLDILRADGGLIDPLCGSGTFPIEAAWIIADIAPGWLRTRFGFTAWLSHDAALWQAIRTEADERRQIGLTQKFPPIIGYDIDSKAVDIAIANAHRAGVAAQLQWHCQSFEQILAPPTPQGLVITNPPYGERLGPDQDLMPLYRQLGQLLGRFRGWKAALLTRDPALAQQVGLPIKRNDLFYNGPLACRFVQLDTRRTVQGLPPAQSSSPSSRVTFATASLQDASTGEDFANRLRKNLRHWQRWARREQVTCYRVYDADLPDYAVAIDLYHTETGELLVHVQEYQAPASIDPVKAAHRLARALHWIEHVLEIPAEHIFLKIRRRQRGSQQYQKQADAGRFYIVREGEARFWVNLSDYLDTGLFLDHRRARQLIKRLSPNKRFLNLFGYTATASIQAALGGAIATTTVDLSNTYLQWAERNWQLNDITGNHRLIQADCLTWQPDGERFDLILLDPPTFSNSKRMNQDFDIQVDHVALLKRIANWLTANGTIIFSTHRSDFRLDEQALADWCITDLRPTVVSPDFRRATPLQCFQMQI